MKTLIILLMFASPAYGWFFGPKNYDECILKYMKDAGSPQAAHEIRQSCENQFYETSPAAKKVALDKAQKEQAEREFREKIVYERDCVGKDVNPFVTTQSKQQNPFLQPTTDFNPAMYAPSRPMIDFVDGPNGRVTHADVCRELEPKEVKTTNATSFSKGLITAAGEYIGVASSYDILLEQGCRPYVQIQKTKSSAVHEVMSRLRQIDPKITINDLYGGKHEEASADRMLREAVGKLVQTGSRGEGLSNSCKAAQWRLDRLYDEASSKWAAESSRVR